jgi:hypothetical protein
MEERKNKNKIIYLSIFLSIWPLSFKAIDLKKEVCKEYCFIGLGASFNIKLNKIDTLYNISEIRINKIIDSSYVYDFKASLKKIENSNLMFKKIGDENFYSFFCLVDTQNIFVDTLIFIPNDSLINLTFLTNYKNLRKDECEYAIHTLNNLVSNKENINEKAFYMDFVFNSVLLRNKINPFVTSTLFMEYCRNKH